MKSYERNEYLERPCCGECQKDRTAGEHAFIEWAPLYQCAECKGMFLAEYNMTTGKIEVSVY
tara:strand:- start:459 stop:644 length:186 start_codon:yes stop_codon:yes gene_type:complete